MGRFRRSLGEKLGAKKAGPAGPPPPGLPWKVRLSVWAGIVLLVAAAVLAVPEWEAREANPYLLAAAAVAAVLGVLSVTYYFTKAGQL